MSSPYRVFLSSSAELGRPNVVTGSYTDGQYEIIEGILPPQATTELHRHWVNTEAFYMLEGSMAFQRNDQTFVATPGNFVYIPKEHFHAWRNLETAPGSFRTLMILTPSGLTEFLVQLGIQGTEPYYEKLVSLSPKYETEVKDSLFFADTEYKVNKDTNPIAAVTVSRVGNSKKLASATIIASGGTAKLGDENYSNKEIQVNFGPQERIQNVVVHIPITDDYLVEGNKTINLTLSNATGGASIPLLQNKATISIVEENVPPDGDSSNNLKSLQELYGLQMMRPSRQLQSFSWRGGTATVVATGKDTEDQYSLFDVLVPPQTGPQSYSNHQENEGFYILAGKLSFQMDDQTITATPGSFVYLPKGQSYTFGNLETSPARLMLISTPPDSVP